MKKISVIMAAWNGSRYIKEQMDSIFAQSLQPDEVIISDDCSRDGTVDIINDYVRRKGLDDVIKLYINEKNVGWKRNFYHAISKSSGDIIFFADQDDVWASDKIKIMSELMEQEKVGCVYGGYEFIDDEGRNISGADKRKSFRGFSPYERSRINTVITMGCRMCISREVAELYLQLEEPDFGYDTQCGRLALLFYGLHVIREPVLKYRIHQTNTSSINSSLESGSESRKMRINDIESNISWLYKLLEYSLDNGKPKEDMNLIETWISFQKKRINYLKGDKKYIWFNLLPYMKYYSDMPMFIGDFAYRHGLHKFMGGLYDHIK